MIDHYGEHDKEDENQDNTNDDRGDYDYAEVNDG
jgi:hypothetical protein